MWQCWPFLSARERVAGHSEGDPEEETRSFHAPRRRAIASPFDLCFPCLLSAPLLFRVEPVQFVANSPCDAQARIVHVRRVQVGHTHTQGERGRAQSTYLDSSWTEGVCDRAGRKIEKEHDRIEELLLLAKVGGNHTSFELCAKKEFAHPRGVRASSLVCALTDEQQAVGRSLARSPHSQPTYDQASN